MALSLAGLWIAPLRAGVWILDGLLVAVCLVEWWLTPRPDSLVLERQLPQRVGLSREFERAIRVDLGAHPRPQRLRGLALELREEFPAPFEVLARTDGEAGRLAPPEPGHPAGGPDRLRLEGDQVLLRRVYRSRLRGVFRLGQVRVALRGRLGLLVRQSRLHGELEIAVEPALEGLSRTLRLAASDRWWELGVRKLRRRGGQTEFESLRDYVHGDDVRSVDWKAFAKRGRPIVRQFQEERGQELILLVDSGRRMRATVSEGGGAGWSKLDWALDAALQLAAVALSKADRVGVAVFDERVHTWVGPARGARQLPRLREAVFHLLPSRRESDLARALRELAARHRRRAMVIVLADVADPLSVAAQRRALAAASSRHRLIFAALDDPALRRAAAGELEHDPDDPLPAAAVRAAALGLVDDRRRALRELSGCGARVLDAVAAEAAGPLLAAWLDERRRA